MGNVIPCTIIAKVGDVCFFGVEVSEDYALKMDHKKLSVIFDDGMIKVGESILNDINEISTSEKKVVKHGNAWCVIRHDTGKEIKCYSISEYGEAEAKRRAYALLAAIEKGGKKKDEVSDVLRGWDGDV